MNGLRGVFFAACLLASLPLAARGMEIGYRLSMPDPVSHELHVQIALRGVEGDAVELQMPAWAPGRYQTLDFARNVHHFTVRGGEASLPFRKSDKTTWRIETQGLDSIEINYQVYADTLSGEYSQLNDFHAFLCGVSVYMYVAGYKDHPVTLDIEPPKDWMILSSGGELGQTHFEYSDYDRMIDELVQLGKFFLYKFRAGETDFYVCIVNNGDRTYAGPFVEQVRRIVNTAVEVMPPLDTPRYTFFFHFLPDSRTTAGMEHLNCAQITRNHDLADHDWKSDLTPWIAAHEFSHAWNVKRLRPQGLGPFDYTQETYTPLLWLVEGGACYLGDLFLLRSGVWNEERFYQWFNERITQFRQWPGADERSVEQSSFDAWLYDDSARGEWNPQANWIDYYLKGELICLCIDLEIRKRSGGEKGFEDFFDALYRRCYEDSAPESYYLKGRSYTEADVIAALNETVDAPWEDLYHAWVKAPGNLPLETALNAAGVKLDSDDAQPPVPYTGLHFITAPGGYPEIDWFAPYSPAYTAGLSRHDVIVAIDGEKTLRDEFDEILRRRGGDGEATLTMLRGDRLITRTMRLIKDWNLIAFQIHPQDDSPRQAMKIRNGWLTGSLKKPAGSR
ncbi:MAG: hypothetical protein GC154_04440 [bacterium]|nr:hypothetical protein [bacterium]